MSYNISHQGKPPQPQSQHPAHSRGQQQSSGHYPREDYQRRQAYQGRQARPGQSPSPGAPPPTHPHDLNKASMAGRPTVTPPPSQSGSMSNPIQPNAGQVVGQPQIPIVYHHQRPMYIQRSTTPMRMQHRPGAQPVNYNAGQIMSTQQPPFIQPVMPQHNINLQYQRPYTPQFQQTMTAYQQQQAQSFYPTSQNIQQTSYMPNQPMQQAPVPTMYQPQPQPRSQQQQTYSKPTRNRSIIKIVDPTTNKDITESIIGESSQSTIPPQPNLSTTSSTPPMNTATPPSQSGQVDSNQAIQAQFAKEVARRAMAPEEESRREEIQQKVVIPKSILPRQDPKVNKPAVVHPVAVSVDAQSATPVQPSLEKETINVEEIQLIPVDETQVISKPIQVEEDLKKEKETSEEVVSSKENSIENVPENISSPDAIPAQLTNSQPVAIQSQSNPDTDATDASQVKESKKKSKKRMQELDKKLAKDDDMFSAYRTEEHIEESTNVIQETELLPETKEQVKPTDTTKEMEVKDPSVIENKNTEINEKSSPDQIVNTTQDRTNVDTSIANDSIADKNVSTQNQLKTDEIANTNVTDQTEKEVLNTDKKELEAETDVSSTEIEIKTAKVLEEEEKENTAPNTNDVTENSKVNEEDTKPNVKDNKIELKYKYREDQWSPINLEGKRQYDREFLMQFKDNCIEKPDGLPKIPEVVLDTANIGSLIRLDIKSNKQNDFMPMYLKSPIIRGQQPNFNSRNSSKVGRVIAGRKVINSKSSEVELKKSENAWKPGSTTGVSDNELQTQEVYRKFKGILNKLAPQKFQKLTNQALELQINTEERLIGVIDLIFEKALSEPNFSVAYAHMCRMLSQIEVPIAGKEGQIVQFRKLLLNRCQREFESESKDENLLKEKRKEIELLPENERDSKKDAFELEVIAAKRRSLGNIKFIGELFKIKMLTEHIMHNCLVQLLKAADDESLECMTKLLSTIGKELDHEKAKFRMDQYFNQMDRIIRSKKNSNRIRFMLQDVIELRENNWIPRREDSKPKTIDQIHQEAREEAVMKKVEAVQAQANRKANRVVRNDRGSLQMDDGEWNVVAKGSGRPQQVDPNKFKVTKQAVDDNVQLGPGGRPGSFGGWGRGASGGGTKPSSSSQERPSSPAANRFSALSDERRFAPIGRSLGTNSRERDFRGGRSSQTKRGSRERDDRPSRDKDRQAAIDTVKRMSASQERNRGPAKVVEPSPPVQPKSEELTEPEMLKKSKAIINEFMHLKDKKEAIECVTELENPNQMHLFVRVAIEETLEKTEQARKVVGELLNELITCKLLKVMDYNKGFQVILEFAEDMAIDIPLIWKYLAQIISPAISGGSMEMKNLLSLLQPVKAIGKSGQLLAEVLKTQAKEIGATVIAEQWAASGLELKQFLNSNEDLKEFIERRELGFLQSALSTSSTSMNLDKMQAELKYILKEQNSENEVVFQWIDRHFTNIRTKENDFIRALTTVVCESAITGEGPASRGDSDMLKRRAPLLQKYIDSKEKRELQALFAVQSLNNSLANPPGLLRLLFDVLYDEDVICEDTFYSWQDCSDPRESEGKGVALKSVTSFFTWLGEAEPDDGPDN